MPDGHINSYAPYGDILQEAIKEGSTLTLVVPDNQSNRLSIDEYNSNVRIIAQFSAGVVAAIETDRKPVAGTPQYFSNYKIIAEALRMEGIPSEDHNVALRYCGEFVYLFRAQHVQKNSNVEEAILNEISYYEGEFFKQEKYRDLVLTPPLKRICEVGIAIAAACVVGVEEKSVETISRVANAAIGGAITGDYLSGDFRGILSVAIARALIAIKLFPR